MGKARVPQALGDTVELVFKTYGGEEVRVAGYEGETVMVRRLRGWRGKGKERSDGLAQNQPRQSSSS